MKKLSFIALVALAGCMTAEQPAASVCEQDSGARRPNPFAYANYSKATAHCDGYQMAYEWQRANQQAVVEATNPKVLSGFVESPEAADALLAKIGDAYDGDPVVLTQIAAVTQMVMCPKCPKAPAGRKVWVAALRRCAGSSSNEYVRTFCNQQLRLCR